METKVLSLNMHFLISPWGSCFERLSVCVFSAEILQVCLHTSLQAPVSNLCFFAQMCTLHSELCVIFFFFFGLPSCLGEYEAEFKVALEHPAADSERGRVAV